MGDNRNYAALDWVLGEISDTLKDARQSLEAYVEDPKDETKIRFCLTHIHQVHGSLQMVEFDGASLLAEEMEHLAQAIMNENVVGDDEAQEVLMRSLLQLPLFLEQIKSLKDDNPRHVLPLLNDLRAARKQEYLSETDLFTPDLSSLDKIFGKRHPVTADAAKLSQVLKKLREMYQFAAASVLRGIKIDENLNYIDKVFNRLEVLTRGTKAHPLWLAAAALSEGLKQDEVELSVAVRGLLRYLARELRILGDKAPKSFAQKPSEGLFKNILYYVAKIERPSEKASVVMERFALANALAGRLETPSAAPQESMHDPEAIRSVVVALQDEMNNIKNVLDYTLNGNGSPQDIADILPVTKRVSDTLAVLGIGDLRQHMFEQNEVLEQIAAEQSIDEVKLMQAASRIIEIEHRLEAVAKAAASGKNLAEIDEREVEIDEAKLAVINQCRIGLEQAKEAIVEYISSQWDKSHLESVGALLTDIRGGLDMIPLARPADIVQSCAQFIHEQLLEREDHPSWETLDTLADAIASVEYFLEHLAGDLRGDSEALLNVAEESVKNLGYKIASDINDAKHSGASLAASDEVADDSQHGDSQEHRELEDQSATVESDNKEHELQDDSYQSEAAPSAIETDDVAEIESHQDIDFDADVSVSSDDSETEVVSATEAPPAATESTPVQEDEDSLVDDEIIEIFIEEAGEVLETLDEYFPRWRSNTSSEEDMTTVRRSFHTLKGSGRMVGASVLGELAWAVENMLNRVIDQTVELGEEHLFVVSSVIDIVPTLVDGFKHGDQSVAQDAVNIYSEWAHNLSNGKVDNLLSEAMAGTLAVPPVAASQEEASGDALDGAVSFDLTEAEDSDEEDEALREIFSSEAQSHLNTLSVFISDMEEAAPIYSPPTDALQRALHTLKGSAKMAQISAIAEMAEPLEHFAKELISYQVAINDDILQLIKDTVEYTSIGLAQIDNGEPVDIPKIDQFVARTAELRELAVGHLLRLKEQNQESSHSVDPELLSIFMAEEMKLLLDGDVIIRGWRYGEPNQGQVVELTNELNTLEKGALHAHLSDLENLSRQLKHLLMSELTGKLERTDFLFDSLVAGHNALLDMVDAVAAGQHVNPAPQDIIDSLNQLASQVSEAPDESELQQEGEPSDSEVASAGVDAESDEGAGESDESFPDQISPLGVVESAAENVGLEAVLDMSTANDEEVLVDEASAESSDAEISFDVSEPTTESDLDSAEVLEEASEDAGSHSNDDEITSESGISSDHDDQSVVASSLLEGSVVPLSAIETSVVPEFVERDAADAIGQTDDGETEEPSFSSDSIESGEYSDTETIAPIGDLSLVDESPADGEHVIDEAPVEGTEEALDSQDNASVEGALVEDEIADVSGEPSDSGDSLGDAEHITSDEHVDSAEIIDGVEDHVVNLGDTEEAVDAESTAQEGIVEFTDETAQQEDDEIDLGAGLLDEPEVPGETGMPSATDDSDAVQDYFVSVEEQLDDTVRTIDTGFTEDDLELSDDVDGVAEDLSESFLSETAEETLETSIAEVGTEDTQDFSESEHTDLSEVLTLEPVEELTDTVGESEELLVSEKADDAHEDGAVSFEDVVDIEDVAEAPILDSIDVDHSAGEDVTIDVTEEALSDEPTVQEVVEPALESVVAEDGVTIPGLLDDIDTSDENYDQDILEVFIEEAEELNEQLDEAIDIWQGDWSDTESVEAIKRALHTFKGGARLSGLANLGELTHEYESYLITTKISDIDENFFAQLHDYQDKLAAASRGVKQFLEGGYDSVKGQAVESSDVELLPEISDGIQMSVVDVVDEQTDAEAANLTEDSVDTAQPESDAQDEAVDNASETLADDAANEHAPVEEKPQGVPGSDLPDSGSANVVPFSPKAREIPLPALSPEEHEFKMPSVAPGGGGQASAAVNKKAGPQEVVRVGADLLEELVNLAGETSISRSRLEQYVSDFGHSLDEMDSTLNRLQEQLRRLDIETEAQVLFRQEQMAEREDFDPLEMDRYSALQQLTRSLAESSSDLDDLKEELSDKLRDTETLLVQQARINTNLQEGLMRSRMVPFSRLVPRLRRIVRQVSSELGKNVSFELDNVEGELDRSVLERMVPPFEHMLRNAVDHGIETPEERIAAGKPETGRIVLTLGREGGDVIIHIADDGRGVNLERVRKKAIERGLMADESQLSDHDIMQFILNAGFSTAENVTQISGRGVGMDVVHSEIKQLGGSMAINSKWGHGTEFVIRLPFTLSVNRALMIEIGSDKYAVPLSSIEGIVRVSPFELEHYYDNPDARFEYANENYHVRYLGGLLNENSKPKLEGHVLPLPVLLVRSAEHTMALHVDALMGSREIVVKSLGQQFAAVTGLSGATVMGDGSVVVILDPHALVRQEIARASLPAPEEAVALPEDTNADKTTTVMVVDDSVTVRKVTSRFLEREGFEVITAKDGVDALRVLQERLPDVMLLDIEMPRMDGFEVAKNIRTTGRWKHLPIIMITSRTGDKHRDHALSLGVNRYLGKPYQEDVLLGSINELIEEARAAK